MSSPIFISYRRSDSQHVTGRLFDRLAPRFLAPAEVFMDTEAIAAGTDFAAALHRQLDGCKVCLVMIGPRWLTEPDAAGRPRIENPADYVRMEVAEALARNITVIPVLVDNARMPTAAELPEPLRALAMRNAVHLVHERFDADADMLGGKVLGALGRSADPELDLLKLLFSFKGTIARGRFWLGIALVYGLQIALLVALLATLGVPLSQGFGNWQSLSAQNKMLLQLANVWVLWPISALAWKRIRDLGHGWDLFAVVLAISLVEKYFFVADMTQEATTTSIVLLVILAVLGSLKGTRFIAHGAS